MLLLFGGYDRARNYTVNQEPFVVYYYRYDASHCSGEWKQFKNMTLSYDFNITFGFSISVNDRYVLLTGGGTLESVLEDNFQFDDSIFIMDIDEGQFWKSKVKCPVKSAWHSIVMPQPPMDKLLVFGYLRGKKIPIEIVEIVVNLYSAECMHLLKDNGHWKVPIRCLLVT